MIPDTGGPDIQALGKVERGLRSLKDVLEMRSIYHTGQERVRAYVFVAAPVLLLLRLLERRLKEAGLRISAEQALQTVATISAVRFPIDHRNPRIGVTRGSTQARQGDARNKTLPPPRITSG